MKARYDQIGATYSQQRQSDPRIASAIEYALDGCVSILNVGAGTGSYEPQRGGVVALDPSWTMLCQRPLNAAPIVQGRAETLPFASGSFDAVLGVLTFHHWRDRVAGIAECARVARRRVVLLTVDPEVLGSFWVYDYWPELRDHDRAIFPGIRYYANLFAALEVTPVAISADCRDGFLGAYWKRPAAFLQPRVRDGISAFSKLAAPDIEAGCQRLAADLESGVWAERYPAIQAVDELDLGYRLVVARVG